MNKENKLTDNAQGKFLADLNLRINQALFDLLYYQLTPRPELKQKLEHCFHTLKNTGTALNFSQLAEVAQNYENYLQTTEDPPQQVILQVIEGLAQIEKEKEDLSTNEPPEEIVFKNEILAPNKVLATTNYTNITYASHLLIADNDIQFLETVERLLRQEGYRITITSSGTEILKILAAQQIDLLLVSKDLIENNNFNLIRELRNKNFKQPIIFLTSKPEEEQKTKEFELGIEKWIAKSTDQGKLFKSIEHLLEGANIYKNKLIRDELTSAYTGKYFQERAQEEKERFIRGGEKFSITLVDLDNFIQINENYGRLAADKLLKDFVKFLRANLRRIDQIYRLRADKFLLLLPSTAGEIAYKVISRLKNKLIKTQFSYQGEIIDFTFSSGVASLNDSQQKISALLEQAKQALYTVKQTAKGEIKLAEAEFEPTTKQVIFIGEQETTISQLIVARLKKLNYQVNTACTTEEVEKLARELNPELVIVDFTCQQIKKDKVANLLANNSQLQDAQTVIFYQDSGADFKQNLELTVDAWLAKPFSLVELEDKLQQIPH